MEEKRDSNGNHKRKDVDDDEYTEIKLAVPTLILSNNHGGNSESGSNSGIINSNAFSLSPFYRMVVCGLLDEALQKIEMLISDGLVGNDNDNDGNLNLNNNKIAIAEWMKELNKLRDEFVTLQQAQITARYENKIGKHRELQSNINSTQRELKLITHKIYLNVNTTSNGSAANLYNANIDASELKRIQDRDIFIANLRCVYNNLRTDDFRSNRGESTLQVILNIESRKLESENVIERNYKDAEAELKQLQNKINESRKESEIVLKPEMERLSHSIHSLRDEKMKIDKKIPFLKNLLRTNVEENNRNNENYLSVLQDKIDLLKQQIKVSNDAHLKVIEYISNKHLQTIELERYWCDKYTDDIKMMEEDISVIQRQREDVSNRNSYMKNRSQGMKNEVSLLQVRRIGITDKELQRLHKAATKIQKIARGFLVRRQYKHLLIIQNNNNNNNNRNRSRMKKKATTTTTSITGIRQKNNNGINDTNNNNNKLPSLL